MSLDSGFQLHVLAQQLDHDSHERLLQRAMELLITSARGLALLNSGAAVSILGFFGALAGKGSSSLPLFKAMGVIALGVFLAGAFLTSAVPVAHRAQMVSESEGFVKLMNRLTWTLLGLSAGCFVTGAIVAAWGIWIAL